jgi:hypothetical protein
MRCGVILFKAFWKQMTDWHAENDGSPDVKKEYRRWKDHYL